MALISMLLLAAPAFANSTDPIGFEGADGNQIVDGGSGASDWATANSVAGPVRHVADASGSSDDTFQGSSENSPQSWGYTQGSASNKADILNFWAASHPPIATPTQSPSAFLYLAFQRAANNTTADASIEFEVNQSVATWPNSSGASVPCRTQGDLLISYDVSPGGGSSADLVPYEWQSTGGTSQCPQGRGSWQTPASPLISNEFEGAMFFGGPIGNCLGGDCSSTTQAGTFGEASIDINGLMTAAGWTPGSCVEYLQAQVRSRTSNSINSNLVDSVAPIVFSDPLNGCAAPPPGQVDPIINQVTAAGTGTDGQLRAGWTPAYKGDSDLTGYSVSLKDAGGNAVGSPLSFGPTVSSVTFDGLTDGAQYTVTVTATNANGHTGSKSGSGSPYGPPSAPGSVSATAGDGSATISWTPPSDNGSPITSYTVTASDGQSITVPAGTTSVVFPGLVNGVSYTFTITANNAAGPGASATTGPVTPVSSAAGQPTVPNEQHVLGAQFLNLPEDCVLKPFTVKLNRANGFTKLVVRVDGHKVRTLKKKKSAVTKTLRIDPTKLKAGRHKVAVQMFKPHKIKASKTARFTFVRCSSACVRGKKLALGKLPKPTGSTIASAVIRVSGKKAVRLAGAKARRRVTVPMASKGKVRVSITVITTDGRVKTYKRRYTRCGQRTGRR